GLVEAGVDPVRVERLQVGIGVDALVGGIGEAVQPFTVPRVFAASADGQLVVGGQIGQRDPVIGECRGRQVPSVQYDLVGALTGQVDERLAARLRAREAHGGGG